jgi:hypothetical protein
MRNKPLSWVIFCAFAVTWDCRPPASDWNGEWKLNSSKSSFQGPMFTISISTNGEYRYDDGRSSSTFACDGKDRPIAKNATRACVQSSATVLDLIQKKDGVKTKVNHWELSPDGKVLTLTATLSPSNAPTIAGQVVAARVSGTGGFAGTWRDSSYLQRHADLRLKLDNQAVHISYPGAGQYIDAPLDGADAKVNGPHAPAATTYSARVLRRREILILTKRNGEAITRGSLELSDDGRVLTESWWNPDQPTGKGTLVYEKR